MQENVFKNILRTKLITTLLVCHAKVSSSKDKLEDLGI
jgi:hypothetical protein